jgi:hypothetical protein
MDKMRTGPNDREEEGFHGDRERVAIAIGTGRRRAQEFAIGAANAEEIPRLTLWRTVRDELNKHGTGQVADEAIRVLFPTGSPIERFGSEPVDKVGTGIVAERFDRCAHRKRPFYLVMVRARYVTAHGQVCADGHTLCGGQRTDELGTGFRGVDRYSDF